MHVINIHAKLKQFEKEQMCPTYASFVHSWWRSADQNILYYWITLAVICSNNSSYHYTIQQWSSRALRTNVFPKVLPRRCQLTCDCYWIPQTLITTCGTFTHLKVVSSGAISWVGHYFPSPYGSDYTFVPFQHGCGGACLTFHSFYSQE